MNYYRRHIGDYLRDTAHLTLLEHGVYTRLLDVYYTREASIPADQAARLIGARAKEERAAVERVLAEFFRLVDGSWVQTRCEAEIEVTKDKAERNREFGKLGGRPRKQEPTDNPDGFFCEPTDNPFPIANSQEPVKTPRAGSRSPSKTVLPEGFCVSDAVRAWAKERGFGSLDTHLSHFVGYAAANGKTYANWDQALMNAIRDDWAKVGTSAAINRFAGAK